MDENKKDMLPIVAMAKEFFKEVTLYLTLQNQNSGILPCAEGPVMRDNVVDKNWPAVAACAAASWYRTPTLMKTPVCNTYKDLSDAFGREVTAQLVQQDLSGKTGWNDPKLVSDQYLEQRLQVNIVRKDYVDVAAYAAILWYRQQPAAPVGFEEDAAIPRDKVAHLAATPKSPPGQEEAEDEVIWPWPGPEEGAGAEKTGPGRPPGPEASDDRTTSISIHLSKNLLQMAEDHIRALHPCKRHECAGQAIGALVDRKNAAYGDAFNRSGAVLREFYPDGIRPDQYDDLLAIVRVLDKLFRIANDKDAFTENPWEDVAGYGILRTVADAALAKAKEAINN